MVYKVYNKLIMDKTIYNGPKPVIDLSNPINLEKRFERAHVKEKNDAAECTLSSGDSREGAREVRSEKFLSDATSRPQKKIKK